MFFDGTIRITYLRIDAPDGLAGLSQGLGVPVDFVESDLTSYTACAPPDDLMVAPVAGLASQGFQGGPFAPSSMTYTLGNAGTNSVFWSVTATQPWLQVSATNGSLAVSAVTNVVLGINTQANVLAPGLYADTVTFSNLVSGFAQTRNVSLHVLAIPGEIAVLDSIPPATSLQMPFGVVLAGASRTEHITVTNTDYTYGLLINDISFGAYVEDFNNRLGSELGREPRPVFAVPAGEYRAQAGVIAMLMQSLYLGQFWQDCAAQVTARRTGSMNSAAVLVLRATDDFD